MSETRQTTPWVSSAVVTQIVSRIQNRRVVALTGAGISTGSGIPDYRGPNGVLRKREPMTYQQFTGPLLNRKRYWARSAVGWPAVNQATPNEAHVALARLEKAGFLSGIITQNVDGLHTKAGAHNVLELHGNLSMVVCLSCGAVVRRQDLQDQLLSSNRDLPPIPKIINPDGDAELDEQIIDRFSVPVCAHCGGILKPDVVYYGESVPKQRTQQAFAMVDQADILLVLGSSLTVFSGYRFAVHAAESGKPVIIVNRGRTRADALAELKIDNEVGTVISAVARRLAESDT